MKDKLNDYTWGIGLEHEMHIFHIPKKNTKEIVKDLILFDSESCIKRLLEDNNAGKIKLNSGPAKPVVALKNQNYRIISRS